MNRKITFRLWFSCILLATLFPCFAVAEEGVVPTSDLPEGALVVSPTLAEIPRSANQRWEAVCVDRSLNLNGDIQSFKTGGFGQWSVGPAVSTQLIKYDFGKKRAGFNTAVGAGAAFRFYRPIEIKPPGGGHAMSTVYISEVKQECRQSSFGQNTKGYLAAPLFSITPTIYASEPVDQDDLSVQPAILLGFFEDILNVGVGFNLTGPAGEKGNVFMLMSIGAGFDF